MPSDSIESLPSLTARERAELDRLLRNMEPQAHYQDYLRATLPKGWTADPDHIKLIAEHLDAVESGEIDRLAVHMPPRHGKTETVTVRYSTYCVEEHPADNTLLTGYNERFARRLGRKARTIAQAREKLGRIQLDRQKRGSDEWATAQGGVMMTRGVGTPPTGVGFRRIIIDDPIRRRQDAESEIYRENVWDWYTDDLYTRLEPGGALILIMTLWHEDDLGARAVASEPGKWTVLKLPAISDDGRALWPERYSVADLERIKSVLTKKDGLRSWEALYQQNPTPREGLFFKISQLAIVAALPAGLRKCRAWDQAATAGDGDWTVGLLVAGPDSDGIWYLADVVRGQWASDERNRIIRQTAAVDGEDCVIRLTTDPGQAGIDQNKAQTRMLAGFNVRSERATGSKTARADPMAAQLNAGNIRMVRAKWNSPLIEEYRAFPNGRNDDQVDAAADAFNALAGKRKMLIF